MITLLTIASLGICGEDSIAERWRKEGIAQSLGKLTPADACFGRAAAITKKRKRMKRQTIAHRRLQHSERTA